MKLQPQTHAGDFGRIGYFHLPGEGAPLLMYHAAGAGNASLLRLAGMFNAKTGRPAYTISLDGYPGTEISVGDDAFERHKTAFRTMLDFAGEPVDIFGHSLGAFTSLNVAKEQDPRILSVTVVEPVALQTLREHAEDAEALALDDNAVGKIAPAMEDGRPEDAVREFISLWNGQPWDTIPEAARQTILGFAPAIWRDTNAIRYAGGFADDYRKIACPVHLIGTDQSPITAGAIISRLHSVNPDWRVSLVEGAGHMGPIEKPDLFAPLIG